MLSGRGPAWEAIYASMTFIRAMMCNKPLLVPSVAGSRLDNSNPLSLALCPEEF